MADVDADGAGETAFCADLVAERIKQLQSKITSTSREGSGVGSEESGAGARTAASRRGPANGTASGGAEGARRGAFFAPWRLLSSVAGAVGGALKMGKGQERGLEGRDGAGGS